MENELDAMIERLQTADDPLMASEVRGMLLVLALEIQKLRDDISVSPPAITLA